MLVPRLYTNGDSQVVTMSYPRIGDTSYEVILENWYDHPKVYIKNRVTKNLALTNLEYKACQKTHRLLNIERWNEAVWGNEI